MEKPISRFMHGIIDYKYAALVPFAPELAGFSETEKSATNICRTLGGVALGMGLFTRYELGACRVLPFKAHLTMDVATGLFALSAPWLFGFDKNTRARNTFLGIGLQSLLVTALTQQEEMGTQAYPKI